MNEQLPPQSIEDQIRVLDGLFYSMENNGNVIQINTGAVGAQNFHQVMQDYINTGVTLTSASTNASELGWMQQGDVLQVIDGSPQQVSIDSMKPKPKKKNFFDLMTITRDE